MYSKYIYVYCTSLLSGKKKPVPGIGEHVAAQQVLIERGDIVLLGQTRLIQEVSVRKHRNGEKASQQ